MLIGRTDIGSEVGEAVRLGQVTEAWDARWSGPTPLSQSSDMWK